MPGLHWSPVPRVPLQNSYYYAHVNTDKVEHKHRPARLLFPPTDLLRDGLGLD